MAMLCMLHTCIASSIHDSMFDCMAVSEEKHCKASFGMKVQEYLS